MRTLTRSTRLKQPIAFQVEQENQLTTVKGIYVLLIQLDKDASITIGAKGKIRFTKGLYAYVGSAQNSLETRIKRHLTKKKRKFWHIDYLLDNPASKIVKVFCKQAAKTDECTVAKEISQQGKAVIGFGCSDCNCKSHLFRVETNEFLPKPPHNRV